MKTVKFIGMAVYKKSIAVAIINEGCIFRLMLRGAKSIPGFMAPMLTNGKCWTNSVVKWFQPQADWLHFVYEADPSGYCIYRHLTEIGLDCMWPTLP